MKHYFLYTSVLLSFSACAPYQENDITSLTADKLVVRSKIVHTDD